MAIDKSQNFITLVRVGYAARGLTYILLGILALGTSGKAVDGAKGVFDYLQEVPLGTPLLWIVALGLLAYGLFKLLSGAANLQHRDSDAMGVAQRIGEIASGVTHLFLAYAAYKFATGEQTSSASSGGTQAMAEPVLDFSLGPVLIGLIGLGLLVAAGMQAKQAVTCDFMKHIASRAPQAVEAVGRAGHAARAVVFAIVGWSLLQGAWFSSESEVKGLGEALLSLRDNGFVYTLVAIGLLLFGAFSLVTARYRIIPDFNRHEMKPSLH